MLCVVLYNRTWPGRTPLITGILQELPTIAIHALLQSGADVLQADDDGFSALHYAAVSMSPLRTDVVQLLLLYGAQPNGRSTAGRTALHFAIRAWSDTLQRVPQGTVNLSNTVEGDPATCPFQAHATVVRTLQEYGARWTIPDANGNTPAQLAAELLSTHTFNSAAILDLTSRTSRFTPEHQQDSSIAAMTDCLHTDWSYCQNHAQQMFAEVVRGHERGSTPQACAVPHRQSLGRLYPREHWEPDKASGGCRICGTGFWLFRRRHHVRTDYGTLRCGEHLPITANATNTTNVTARSTIFTQ